MNIFKRTGDSCCNKMITRFHGLTIIIAGLLVCLAVTTAFSQKTETMWVSEVRCETSTKLLITARVKTYVVKVGENIPVSITVENHGDRPVYYVSKEELEIQYRQGEVYIFTPNPFPEDKEEYDFAFHKIDPKGRYDTQIIIPGRLISEESKLQVSVGLGFVYDISGLNRKLGFGEDPMRLRGLLGKRLETIRIGELDLTSTL